MTLHPGTRIHTQVLPRKSYTHPTCMFTEAQGQAGNTSTFSSILGGQLIGTLAHSVWGSSLAFKPSIPICLSFTSKILLTNHPPPLYTEYHCFDRCIFEVHVKYTEPECLRSGNKGDCVGMFWNPPFSEHAKRRSLNMTLPCSHSSLCCGPSLEHEEEGCHELTYSLFCFVELVRPVERVLKGGDGGIDFLVGEWEWVEHGGGGCCCARTHAPTPTPCLASF